MAYTTGELVSLALISLIALACLALNILLLVVMCRRRKLKKPFLFPVFNLAAIDLVALCLWTALTAVYVAQGSSYLPWAVCHLQGYFATFYSLASWHGLCLLALERLVKIWRPFNHSVIFSGNVVLLMIGGFWLVDGVIAVFSVAGWSTSVYYAAQFQCAPNFRSGYSYLNFLFVFVIVLPVVVLVVCFVLTAWRIRVQRRQKVAPSGAITLEGKNGHVLDPYGVRVLRQAMRFHNVGMKAKKPRLQHVQYTTEGYVSDSDSSSEEDIVVPTYGRVEPSVYHLAKSDFDLLKTYVIVSCVHFCLWFPLFVVRYTWTFSVYTPMADTVWTVVVWLAQAATFVKPVVYFSHNPAFKAGLRRTCCVCCKRRRKS